MYDIGHKYRFFLIKKLVILFTKNALHLFIVICISIKYCYLFSHSFIYFIKMYHGLHKKYQPASFLHY